MGRGKRQRRVAQDLVAAADARPGRPGRRVRRRGWGRLLHSTVGALGLDLRERTRFERVRGGRAAPRGVGLIRVVVESSECALSRKESSGRGVAFSELSSGSSAVTEGVFGRSSETGLAAFALRTSMYANPSDPTKAVVAMRSLERRRESSYSRGAYSCPSRETVSGVSGAGGSPPTARSFSAFPRRPS